MHAMYGRLTYSFVHSDTLYRKSY